jgi:hypothetical protein
LRSTKAASVGGLFHCNPDGAASVLIGQSQKLERGICRS